MVDKYVNWVSSGTGKKIAKKLGLPQPVKLKHYAPEKVNVGLNVLVGGFKNTPVLETLHKIVSDLPINTFVLENNQVYRKGLGGNMPIHDDKMKFHSLIFDASGIQNTQDLQSVRDFFNPFFRKINECGRIIVLAHNPDMCQDIESAMSNRSLVGFIKSLGKEVRRGIAVQIVYVTPDSVNNLQSTIEFLLSYKSAYVSGQVIKVHKAQVVQVDRNKPLLNKLALVTGASRGIGKSIAEVLARDGAKVVLLDIDSQRTALEELAKKLDGLCITLDITADNAPQVLSDFGKEHGGWDIIVHNAGITKDKMFVNMTAEIWNQVIHVNLTSQQRINALLLKEKAINPNGRIICVSSIAGIAGNAGQTNYATSKAGVIGMVEYTAKHLLTDGITINAVAPGFIETDMTAKIPFVIRETGRRLNAMSQGGLPIDVAETIAWYANPASSGLNGNIVRVCGLMMLGA
ncbi:MAG: 3-oxoacyl-ACP reductase [Neisseriaceae bacterium]|nr:MAG: 3-oxoacyl-ACP reductase [Neisseriaceae bacterium]